MENIVNEKMNTENVKYTVREYELVQELVKLRQENEEKFQFEDLEGYVVPPRTQFSTQKKPAVTIKSGQLKFNRACLRLFQDVQYVLPVVHEGKHRIAVIPCQEEESCSIDWARKNRKGNWVSKPITNRTLVDKIGELMNWNKDCRYKILGEVRMSARGLILVFELDEAVMFSSETVEVENGEAGRTHPKRIETRYYPDKYKGRIGLAYSDYVAGRQMNLFEDFSNYFQTDGKAVAMEKQQVETLPYG